LDLLNGMPFNDAVPVPSLGVPAFQLHGRYILFGSCVYAESLIRSMFVWTDDAHYWCTGGHRCYHSWRYRNGLFLLCRITLSVRRIY